MAELYRQSQVVVSLTTHDGTPNTLLEALACGCFPWSGDTRIAARVGQHGEKGLPGRPLRPRRSCRRVLRALSDPACCAARAAEINLNLIRQRAEYGEVMRQASEFYQTLR